MYIKLKRIGTIFKKPRDQTADNYETKELEQNPKLAWLTSYEKKIKDEHSNYLVFEKRWSWTRLLFFSAGTAIVVWLLCEKVSLFSIGIAGIFLAIFTYAVSRHNNWLNKRKFTEKVLLIAKESLRHNSEYSIPIRTWSRPIDSAALSEILFPILEDGPTWALTDQERNDLDLYAPPVGIFGFLNRTSTELGARRLCNMIDNLCLSTKRIKRRQACIKWLEKHQINRIHLMATMTNLRGQDDKFKKLVSALSSVTPLLRPTTSLLIRLWSIFSGLFSIYAFAKLLSGQYKWVPPVLALLCFNYIVFRPIQYRLRTLMTTWQNISSLLRSFLTIAQQGVLNLPTETDLGLLRRCFMAIVEPKIIPSLCSRLDWLTSIGGLPHKLLNIVFFNDLHLWESILGIIIPNRNILLKGFSAIADLEALCSLACLAAEQPGVCYPTPVTNPVISIVAGQHPLIVPSRVVSNNIHLNIDKRMWIITGPNMAGKSTLLCMVGVNIILAQMGAVAIAQNMTWSPIRLITDLKIQDNLSKEESYFLSEVRHLRRIVSPEASKIPVLGLIDEPFRGTNSQENCAASLALVEYLLSSNNFFLIATHNESLTRIAHETSSAENYHFREKLASSGIVFDYCLRPGAAKTRIAIKILEQENYPPELIACARKWMVNKNIVR